jgi:uncharacterized heparinase superfamily protein
VTKGEGFAARRVRALNRLESWRAGMTPPAKGFVSQPEPRTIGLFARGRQLIAGNVLLAGFLVEAKDASLWDMPAPDVAFEAEAHGFAWLDDLAAVGSGAARTKAQGWTWGWIDRYGRGRGPGWTPDLTGRRLIRWINHALLLLTARSPEQSGAYFTALSRQTVFLSRRWKAAEPGLPRFEALSGLIYAGLALTGMESHVEPAVAALARECAREVDAQGGIPTRNPEELLEVFTLLTWAAQALSETGQRVPPEHLAAIERIAPTLRALRHADGGLARFHGGGRGLEGRLDHALASSGVKALPNPGLSMGFARLATGRTTVIVDAASPPSGRASRNAHASTLGFELTSGRRPLIVNCGSGAPFGPEWHRAGRATASHSTLAIDGYSSSRVGPKLGGRELMVDLADTDFEQRGTGSEGSHIHLAHEGWSATHGLTHSRSLMLAADGRRLAGEDALIAQGPAAEARFEAMLTHTAMNGVHFAIRFHLHPDVDAALDLGGKAVSMALKSSEIWVFRYDGPADLTLEASVYLEKGRLKPRAAKQIVLSGRMVTYQTRIGWTLAKAQDTPLAIRDLDRDDPTAPQT